MTEPHDFEPGARIGSYRLLERIGEGGFGSVWSAQQEVPVRRVVAVKILKLGMDTKQVVSRFETERQALAVMDHPSIAKVFDGGATETGRPYFVMELVKGVPITRFCDDANMPVRERLELFREVCSAVQHAHQKGIIHRDLKPTNILVGTLDGRPQPKIIDFGVAKAVRGTFNDRTVVTEVGQVVGTPEYMAPEQADDSGTDVDTRADVYSLGVVLYELLTGTKPFEIRTMKGYAELMRTIREVDPPRPSTRVNWSADSESFARLRGTSKIHLHRALRGDLDWIVAKAMDKDRSNRYATAQALAEDIDNHLADRPVRASPPSAAQRMRKYVRRHRVGVAAGAAIALSLVAGLVAAASGYVEASDQRDAAKHAEETAKTEARRAEQVVEILTNLFESADPYSGQGGDYTVRELLDEFDSNLTAVATADPEIEATVHRILGRAYRGLGDREKSAKHFIAAHEIHLDLDGLESERSLETLVERVYAYNDAGDYATAEQHALEGLAIARRIAPESQVLGHLLYVLGNVISAGRAPADAVPYLREALSLRERLYGPNDAQTGNAMFALGRALMDGNAEEQAEAEKLFLDRVAVLRIAGKPDHPNVAMALDNLGRIAMARRDPAAAERYLRDAIDIQRRRLGDDHPDLATSLCTLGTIRRLAGALDEAREMLEEAVEIYRKRLGDDHPDLGVAMQLLAVTQRERGELDDAERLLVKACTIFRNRLGPDHESYTTTLDTLAAVQRKRGDLDGTERSCRELYSIYARLLPPDHLDVTSSAASLAIVLTQRARAESSIDKAVEAERIFREVIEQRAGADGEDHWRVATLRTQLADALVLQSEKIGEARTLALQSVARLSTDGVVPAESRAIVFKAALERGVRVLEAASSVAPDSADTATMAEWKRELDALQAPAK